MKNGLEISNYGNKYWYLNDQLHRLEGPAVIYLNQIENWFLNDIEYEEDEHPFNQFRNQYNLSLDYNSWTTDMKMLFKLTYGGSI